MKKKILKINQDLLYRGKSRIYSQRVIPNKKKTIVKLSKNAIIKLLNQ